MDDLEKVKQHYSSKESIEYYQAVWGEEDIHLGIYKNKNDSIQKAMDQSTQMLMSLLIKNRGLVLDMGSGYGGDTRKLIKAGYDVACIDMSEKANKINERKNIELGVSEPNIPGLYPPIIQQPFEMMPFPDNSFDIVWSHETIIHSPDRRKTLEQVNRVLNPGGQFIFTDMMGAEKTLRSYLDKLGSRISCKFVTMSLYEEEVKRLPWREYFRIELNQHFLVHYQKLLSRYKEFSKDKSKEQRDVMINGLSKWIEAIEGGYLKYRFLSYIKEDD